MNKRRDHQTDPDMIRWDGMSTEVAQDFINDDREAPMVSSEDGEPKNGVLYGLELLI